MNLKLQKPELEQYINGLIKAGRFSSAEAVVEDALLRAMNQETELTDEDQAAIDESERQLDGGQGIDSKDVRARMQALFSKAKS